MKYAKIRVASFLTVRREQNVFVTELRRFDSHKSTLEYRSGFVAWYTRSGWLSSSPPPPPLPLCRLHNAKLPLKMATHGYYWNFSRSHGHDPIPKRSYAREREQLRTEHVHQWIVIFLRIGDFTSIGPLPRVIERLRWISHDDCRLSTSWFLRFD